MSHARPFGKWRLSGDRIPTLDCPSGETELTTCRREASLEPPLPHWKGGPDHILRSQCYRHFLSPLSLTPTLSCTGVLCPLRCVQVDPSPGWRPGECRDGSFLAVAGEVSVPLIGSGRVMCSSPSQSQWPEKWFALIGWAGGEVHTWARRGSPGGQIPQGDGGRLGSVSSRCSELVS